MPTIDRKEPDSGMTMSASKFRILNWFALDDEEADTVRSTPAAAATLAAASDAGRIRFFRSPPTKPAGTPTHPALRAATAAERAASSHSGVECRQVASRFCDHADNSADSKKNAI